MPKLERIRNEYKNEINIIVNKGNNFAEFLMVRLNATEYLPIKFIFSKRSIMTNEPHKIVSDEKAVLFKDIVTMLNIKVNSSKTFFKSYK